MDNFNFDVWAKLANTAPDEFEQQRREVVNSLISNSAGNIRRLQGLQFSIDLERMHARTPLKSCLRISTLMWDAFIELDNELNTFLDFDRVTTNAPSRSEQSAKIIHLSTEVKPHK